MRRSPKTEKPANRKTKRAKTGKTADALSPLDDIMSALPAGSRAALRAHAAPGSPAAKMPLADGETLFDRMRFRAACAEIAEKQFPNVREMEAQATTLWAKHETGRGSGARALSRGFARGAKLSTTGTSGHS